MPRELKNVSSPCFGAKRHHTPWPRMGRPTTSFALTGRSISNMMDGDEAPMDFFLRLKPNTRVLDVGCGNGQVVTDLRQGLDFRAIARELSLRRQIGLEQALYNTSVFKAQLPGIHAVGIDPRVTANGRRGLYKRTIQNARFPKQSFDHILSIWSIFSYGTNQDFRVRALNKMAQWLKPDGTIILGGNVAKDTLLLIDKVVQPLQVIRFAPREPNHLAWIELAHRKTLPLTANR